MHGWMYIWMDGWMGSGRMDNRCLPPFIHCLQRRQWPPLQYSCLENPMDGGAWWAAVHGVATGRLHFHFSLSCIGEGHGNPLQCSCLENPRDGRTWWAAVSGVAKSWTQLKRLSSSSSSIHCLLLGWMVCLSLPSPIFTLLPLLCRRKTPAQRGSVSHLR